MLYYHVWFSPKRRRAILEGEIAKVAREGLLDTARVNGIGLIECETSYDHVHLVVALNEQQNLASVMHQLKGASAHRVFQHMPELKLDLKDVSLWQRGYGHRKVEPAELPRVRQYVRGHREEPEPRVFNPRVGQ